MIRRVPNSPASRPPSIKDNLKSADVYIILWHPKERKHFHIKSGALLHRCPKSVKGRENQGRPLGRPDFIAHTQNTHQQFIAEFANLLSIMCVYLSGAGKFARRLLGRQKILSLVLIKNIFDGSLCAAAALNSQYSYLRTRRPLKFL